MSTMNVSIKYRPLRLGFLVDKDSIENTVIVAGLNTLLWGGIYNPIIPISEDLGLANKLIKVFSVDVLCPIGSSSIITELLEEYRSLSDPPFFFK